MNALTKIGVPFAAALMSAAVSAGPIVTSWGFSTDANFTGAIFEAGGVGSTVSNADELSWGATGGFFQQGGVIADGNRSALTIGVSGSNTQGGGPATGSIDTIVGPIPPFPLPLANFGLGISFTHWNNPINSNFNTLLSGVISDTLTLTPTAPDAGPAVDAPVITFNFNFAETPNSTPCLITGPGTSVCNDIFAFELPGGGLNQSFTYDGNTYFAQVLLLNGDLTAAAPIAPLGATVCGDLGLSDSCLGFTTNENAATTVSFGFAVSTRPVNVPLPSTLALFGLGLLGLGYRARRKAA